MTASFIDESKVRGQDFDKSYLLELLLLPDNKTSSSSTGVIEKNKVISIVEVGGSGKTTLAQFLYNDHRVKRHFELIIWVCVSDPFDTKRIAEALLANPETSNINNVSGLESLFQLIRDYFSGRKFFIVFDDVWIEDLSKWEPFRNSLKDGAPGSIILVTTRSERVARVVGSNYVHRLSPLSDLDCWSIIKGMALPEEKSMPKELENIGKQIARQCRGSPLVAKTVGALLQKRTTKEEWRLLLDNDIFQRKEVIGALLRDFNLSYQPLPPELKVCFSYCAVFPRDTDIEVERLERLWAAVGRISISSGGERGSEGMEKRGYEYFKDLVARSFFGEVKSSIHKNKMTSCKIPQLFYVGLRYSHPYLSMPGQKKKFDYSVWKDRKTRCVVVHSPCEGPPDLFESQKYLRALVLSSCQLEQLPSYVEKLSLLRYLDLSGNPLMQLPETICDLILLESLDVHDCYLLSSLPKRVGELQQLRHLRVIYTTDELHSNLPPGFEKLTLIQTLDVIKVGGEYNNIAKLRDFEYLEDIRIVIYGEVDFEEAKLESKLRMENLELCFAGEGCDIEKPRFIKRLRPPPKLQMLKLEGYPGAKLPKWIVGDSMVNYLRRLSLKSALNISSFPALWKLSTLEFLWLYDLPNLKHLGLEFLGLRKPVHPEKKSQKTGIREWDEILDEEEISSSDTSEDDEETAVLARGHPKTASFRGLETLRVEYLENWETWEDLNENQISVMPKLKDLHIHGCPNLKALPSFILGKWPGLSITAEPKLLPALSIPGTSKAASIKE